MLKIIKEFLKENEWQYSQVDDRNIFIFGIGGKNGNFQCIIDIDENDKKFLFSSLCGANTPIEKRKDILELINIFNTNLYLGNFVMGTEDGEVRYKTNLEYKFITPNKGLVTQLIMVNIITMDTHLPGIMGAMYGGLTPTQAFNLIDEPKNSL